MNATLERRAATTRASDPSVARRTLGALAVVEGWRLLRHPAILAGLAISVWWLTVDGRGLLPVLDRADVTTAVAIAPLAGGVLLAANQAALRSRRHGTEELYGTVPASPATRTGAHLAALLGVVALAAVLAAAKLAWLAAVGGVRAPDPGEAAVGPALVALAGVIGVLLARWAPSPLVAPVALLALAVGELWPSLYSWSGRDPRYLWLRPWQELDGPREVAYRPAGWHLLYLAALAALLAVLALARHGRLPGRVVTGGLALVVVAGTAWAQLRPAPAAAEAAIVQTVERPQASQACQRRGTVRYCHFSGYGQWVDRWAAVVGPVLARLPGPARGRPVQVRQDIGELWRLDGLSASTNERLLVGARWHVATDRVIPVGMSWGTGRRGEADAFDLALRAAVWAVGLPVDLNLPGEMGSVCDTNGQARAVVAVWLAGQARPAAKDTLRGAFAAPPSAPDAQRYFLESLGASPLGRIPPPWLWSKPDGMYALQLLDRPAGQVAAALGPRWDRLVDPATPTAELVSALGLRPEPAPPPPPAATSEHPGWQPPRCR
jgi:hypothetical protein